MRGIWYYYNPSSSHTYIDELSQASVAKACDMWGTAINEQFRSYSFWLGKEGE